MRNVFGLMKMGAAVMVAATFSLLTGCGDDSTSVNVNHQEYNGNPLSSAAAEPVNPDGPVNLMSSAMDPVALSSSSETVLVPPASSASVTPPASGPWVTSLETLSTVLKSSIAADTNGFYDIGDVYKALDPADRVAFVIRHSEREDGLGKESNLTERGVEMAHRVGEKLAGGDESFYYASTDFVRTRRTCEEIAAGRGESGVEVVTWEDINGGYFLTVPTDTFDNYAKNKGGSWSMMSRWMYQNTSNMNILEKVNGYFYEMFSRGNQFVNEVILANMPNWKRVSILVSHDVLLAPMVVYASNRTIDLNYGVSSKWVNYLSGVAVVWHADDSVEIIPIRGNDIGWMYTGLKAQ